MSEERGFAAFFSILLLRAMSPPKAPMVWDMETGDPDDFLTLLLLLDHPAVELRAVTITPGALDQVGLVRRALSWFERTDVPVGAGPADASKRAVSGWHTRRTASAAVR